MRTGKTIAILPARGGSRRLQRKNLYPVFGESMLSWVVKSCRQVEAVEDIYVSSEDAEILAAAEALGCRLIQRPPELAEDEVPKIQAVRHAVRQIGEGDVQRAVEKYGSKDAFLRYKGL